MEKIRTLDVPRSLVEKSNGFAVDIGGSVVKLVYLSKDEMLQDNKSDKVQLHMATCSKDDVDSAFDYIKKNVFIRPSDSSDPPIIQTTGVGSNQMTDRFNSELGIRINNTVEMDDFVKAASFLMSVFSTSDVFEPYHDAAFWRGVSQLKISAEMMESWSSVSDQQMIRMDADKAQAVTQYCKNVQSRQENGLNEHNDKPCSYPYLLVQMGSGFVYLKVFKDGTYKMMDLAPFAGRSFLDLGCLLTGAQNYNELIELAEAGNEDNMNVRMCDSVQDVTGDAYSMSKEEETVIYSLGKLHGKKLDEVNKADLARGLLQTVCANALQFAVHLMTRENCRDVVMTGSFVSSTLTQQILTQNFETKRGEYFEFSTPELPVCDLRMRVVRSAGILGALGAFLTGCE